MSKTLSELYSNDSIAITTCPQCRKQNGFLITKKYTPFPGPRRFLRSCRFCGFMKFELKVEKEEE